MARHATCDSDTTYFHIIVQGLNKENIFGQDSYKSCFLNYLTQLKQECGVKLFAYCVMDNHCHILLKSETREAITTLMRKLNTRYAQYYNYKENRTGYVFRDRYKSQPIYDVKYLVTCILYIHFNPIKAKIVQSPEEYQFSSYNEFINCGERIDLDELNQIIDASPKNIAYLTQCYSSAKDDIKWLDVDEAASPIERMNEILSDMNLTTADVKKDNALFVQVATNLNRQGFNKSQIAALFGCSREYISRLLKQ